jgi:hypothetical protein
MPGLQPACVQEVPWWSASRSEPLKARTSKRSGKAPDPWSSDQSLRPSGGAYRRLYRPPRTLQRSCRPRELPKQHFFSAGRSRPGQRAAAMDRVRQDARPAFFRRSANSPGPDLLLHDGMQRQRPRCAAKKYIVGKRHGRGTFRLESGEGGGGTRVLLNTPCRPRPFCASTWQVRMKANNRTSVKGNRTSATTSCSRKLVGCVYFDSTPGSGIGTGDSVSRGPPCVSRT